MKQIKLKYKDILFFLIFKWKKEKNNRLSRLLVIKQLNILIINSNKYKIQIIIIIIIFIIIIIKPVIVDIIKRD